MSALDYLRKFANGKLEGNKFTEQEIVSMLLKEKLLFYREKYGFISILTGFDIKRKKFRLVAAPLSYAIDEIPTYLHIGHILLSEHERSFDEVQRYSFEVRPLSRFWKWFLINIKGLKTLPPTYTRDFKDWLESKKDRITN